MRRPYPRARQYGAIYLVLIFIVALSGILLAGFGQVWATAARREKEAQLLHVGHAYRRAIVSYYNATPGDAKQYPLKLEDLLLDKRFPYVRRHLRRLYPDPMSAGLDWGLVLQQGRIQGVFSKDERTPIKQGGFEQEDSELANAKRYRDWRFVSSSSAGATDGPGQGGAPGAAAVPGVH